MPGLHWDLPLLSPYLEREISGEVVSCLFMSLNSIKLLLLILEKQLPLPLNRICFLMRMVMLFLMKLIGSRISHQPFLALLLGLLISLNNTER